MNWLFLLSSFGWILKETFCEETYGGTDTSSETEDSEELTPMIKLRVATSIFLIITILLVLSSFFEFLKDMVKEMTPEKMREVMDVLFSEMTVLGFLSLVTFCISKAGTLAEISETIFGQLEDGEDFLEELLESIHYDLFLVMVLFIAQTLSMIRLGASSEKQWEKLEKMLQDKNQMKEAQEELEVLLKPTDQNADGRPRWWEFKKKARINELFEVFEFASLKKEFLHGRDLNPPFNMFDDKEQLPKNFNYGNYLTIRMSKFMADVIDMNVQTWLLMEFFLLFFYVVMFSSESDSQLLMWVWVGLGYSLMISMILLKRRTKWMREMCINPEDMPSIRNDFKSTATKFHRSRSNTMVLDEEEQQQPKEGDDEEKQSGKVTGLRSALGNYFSRSANQTHQKSYSSIKTDGSDITSHEHLARFYPWRHHSARTFFDGKLQVSESVDFDKLPGWCHLELNHSSKPRHPIMAFLFGKAPNRQQMLFSFQANGPKAQTIIMRILLFMHAVYVAVLVLEFYDDAYLTYGLEGFFIYFGVGLLPTIFFFLYALPTVKDTVHMGNIGIFRVKRDIAYVIREDKTKKALKSLILLKNLQNRLQKGLPGDREKSLSSLKGKPIVTSIENKRDIFQSSLISMTLTKDERLRKLRDELGSSQFDEISKMFDLYDRDGGGEIDSSELKELMASLGTALSDFESDEMMKMLDIDGDGSVSKEEFLIWHIDQIRHPPSMEPEEVAKQLFKIFDKDDGGEITVGEFKEVLDKFNVGLSVDEVADLARELDVDGDGTISEEEFAALLKKHKDEIIG